MDAPLYPPASAYQQPDASAYQMTTSNTSAAALMARPEAAAIIRKEFPLIDALSRMSGVQAMVTTVGIVSLNEVGVMKDDVLARIDAQLAQLPPAKEIGW